MAHSPRRPNLDLIVAASAVFISIASLWVAVREVRTQERLLAASVWPFVQTQTSDIPSSSIQQIDLTLQNAGVGPARIRWMTVYYKDRAYKTAADALRACCGARVRLPTTTFDVKRRVLTAGQTIAFIHLPKTPSDAAVWSRFDVERQNLVIRGCYCSVLDECWLFDSRRAQPQAVGSCPAAEEPEFEG